MSKSVSVTELSQLLLEEGLEFEAEERAPLDLSPLVAELKAIAEKREDNTALLKAIEALTRAVEGLQITVSPTDLSPVLDAVRLIKSAPQPIIPAPKPTGYRFNVVRDQRNLIEYVDVVPQRYLEGSE